MAISSEIEKLEKRWLQSSGLVFAPLAEAYRKAGLQARALEILEQGLALHAEYAPALIVRARCHLDTGDLGAAEEAFNQALGRDPNDPIALRGLADVFERTGRLPEAVDKLRALVDVDPRNSEARQVLDRLLATPAPVPEVVAAAPVPEPAPESFEPARDQLDSLDFDVVNLSAVESLPALPEASFGTPVDEDFLVQSFAVEPLEVPAVGETPGPILWTPAPIVEAVETVETVAPDPIEPTEPEPVAAEVAEPIVAEVTEPIVADIAGPIVAEIAEPTPVDERPSVEVAAGDIVDEADLPASELPELQLPELNDAPGAEPEMIEPEAREPVEFVGEAAADPVFDLVDDTAVAQVDEESPEVGAPVEVEEVVEVVALVEEPTVEEYASRVDSPIAVESVAEPEPVGTPVLIVTESMAELFLKQGHRELALAVYRQLLERSPDADHLLGSIARLEQELAPPPAPEPPAPVRQAYAAAETGGRSVERRLQAVLHAPPPSTASTVLPPAIEPGAEPTRASGDSLSLAAVFGDEPARNARREEEPAPPSDAGEPSYDEFFGAGPTEPAAAPAPRGEGEDLRQFNEWLKGLKR